MPKRLCQQLLAVDLDDPDVVRGVLAALFERLPLPVQEKQHEEAMHASALCYGASLRLTTARTLEGIGIPTGEAVMMVELIERGCFDVVEVPDNGSESGGVVSVSQANVSAPRQQLRPFPALEASGYPSRRGWTAFVPGLKAMLRAGGGSEQIVEALTSVEGGGPDGEQLEVGAADQAVLMNLLLNGSSPMPEDLVLLLPPKLVSDGLGLEIYKHITAAVMSSSEEAMGELEEQFRAQRAVIPSGKHLLISVLQEFENRVRKLKEGGVPQSAAAQKKVLKKMIERLPEVRDAVAAAEAAFEAAHEGQEVPVNKIVAVIKKRAVKFSSVSKVVESEKVLYAAFGAVAEGAGEPKKKRECPFWKKGTCRFGAKCNWRHIGKPGVNASSGRVAACLSNNADFVSGYGTWSTCSRPGGFLGECVSGDAPVNVSADVAAMCELWLAQKSAGVAAALSIAVEEAAEMILSVLQERVLKVRTREGSKGDGMGVGKYMYVVVADTGASVRVIGKSDVGRARTLGS